MKESLQSELADFLVDFLFFLQGSYLILSNSSQCKNHPMNSCWSLVIDSNGWDVCMTAFIFYFFHLHHLKVPCGVLDHD